jgi:hypothetical protein
VLLQWPDPAIPFIRGQDDIAPKALVNDLDLVVIDPLGNTIRPYVLDKNSPTANATTGVNTVDNTEMVEIANATPGIYRIDVTGKTVPQGPQTAVLVSSTRIAPPCVDIQEPNDTPETAEGFLVPRSEVSAALCTQEDVDYYKFLVTKAGSFNLIISNFDVPIRVTISGPGISLSNEYPANRTSGLGVTVSSVPSTILVKVEATGPIGAEPRYTFTPVFGETNQPRRRSVR